MNRHKHRIPLFLLAAAAALLVSGCTRRIGWGVALWSFDAAPAGQESAGSGAPAPGSQVVAGTIVPVLIKSNINQVYVVEVPETGAKVEVPLWKIELHKRRSDAESSARTFEPYARLYAATLRDGLVLRQEPRNLADQVYRLRRDQVIKLLEKVEGDAVTTGGTPLPGDWYLAMGEDGTRGYVFSNQLRIYDETEAPPPAADADSGRDFTLEVEPLFVKSWRPAYFRTMIEQNRVDLDHLAQHYGIFVDGVRRQIRIEYPGASRFFNYSAIRREADGGFRFEGLPLVIRFLENDFLELTIESDYGAGTYLFEAFNQDIREIVRREELRRRSVLEGIIADGERFVSDEWGALTLTRTGRFTWAAYEKLIPEAVPEYSGDVGIADPALYLGPALEGAWDGGLSLTFDGGQKPRVDFVYRLTRESLTLQLVRSIDREWAVVNTLSEPALVLQFRRSLY